MKYGRSFPGLALISFVAFFLSAGCAQPRPEEAGPTKPNAPVITHSYAADKGRFGSTWKIYIEARARNGEMDRIMCRVHQIGYGEYTTFYIPIKPSFRKYLKGYIQWNTFSNRAPFIREGTQITLRISILDKAQNESNVAVFPFQFIIGKEPQSTPPPPFDQGKLPLLGNILINLEEPSFQDPGPIK